MASSRGFSGASNVSPGGATEGGTGVRPIHLILGNIKIRGIGLGTAGVLFSGILFGHFGNQLRQPVDHNFGVRTGYSLIDAD